MLDLADPRQEIKSLLESGDLKSLLIKAASLHGHYCPGLASGVKAGHAGLKRLGFDNSGMEELVAIVECNNCFVDGIQLTTGCSLGNNALIYKDVGKTAVTIACRKTNTAVRVACKPRREPGEDACEDEKEGAELFRRLVKERQDDPEARKRFRELWPKLSFKTLEKPDDELFDIAEVPADLPEYAPIFDSAICAVCGEQFMETRGLVRGGKPTCMSCAQADCFAVMGRGVRVLPGGAMC